MNVAPVHEHYFKNTDLENCKYNYFVLSFFKPLDYHSSSNMQHSVYFISPNSFFAAQKNIFKKSTITGTINFSKTSK